MMKTIENKFFLIAVIVLSGIFSSCTKYIEVEGENRQQELVLNGLMIADSIFAVELPLSKGYVDTGRRKKVGDGVVEIFDDQGQLIETLHHTQEGIYLGNETPLAGHSYTVKAEKEGLNVINARGHVP